MHKKSIWLVIMIWLGASLPVYAQDDQATINRVLGAIQSSSTYQSYIRTVSSQQVQEFALFQDGEEIQANSLLEIEENFGAIIRGENPNGFYASIRTVTEDDTSYTIQGELRFVDGILYGKGEFTNGTSTLYTFEDGYVVIDDSYTGDLSTFESDIFVDELNGINSDADNPLNNPEILQTTVTSTSVETGDLDGLPVEILTLNVDSSNLADFFTALSDPEDLQTIGGMLSAADASSGASIRVYLGEGDQILKSEVSILVNIANMDMAQMDAEMAGFTGNILLQLDIVETYSQINALSEAIAAPQ